MTSAAIRQWFKVPGLAGMYALIALSAGIAFFLIHELVGLIRLFVDSEGFRFSLYQNDLAPIFLGTILGLMLLVLLLYSTRPPLAWLMAFDRFRANLPYIVILRHFRPFHLQRFEIEVETARMEAMQTAIKNLVRALELSEKIADPALREEIRRNFYAAMEPIAREEESKINLIELGNWVERIIPILERRSVKP